MNIENLGDMLAKLEEERDNLCNQLIKMEEERDNYKLKYEELIDFLNNCYRTTNNLYNKYTNDFTLVPREDLEDIIEID